MTRFTSKKALLFPLMLVLAGSATQAEANWFHDPTTGFSKNPGSAADPKPKDLIAIREGADYPLQSRMFNEQGKVGLKVWLTEQGEMADAVVQRSSGYPRLDEAAVRYIRDHWNYRTAHKTGRMPKTVLAEVTFRLQ